MKLIKEEYALLYFISRVGLTNFEKLKGRIEKEEAEIIVKKLEKLGFVKISYWRGELYGFMETKKGEKLLSDKEYEEWYNELGD